jgi:uncharacterized membrane protein
MAWRERKSVVGVCVLCAALPTLFFFVFADCVSVAVIGPPFWAAGGLIGIFIGLVAGLLACVLAKYKIVQVPPTGPRETEVEIADEHAVRATRYFIGIFLAVVGAVICCGFLLDLIHHEIRQRF